MPALPQVVLSLPAELTVPSFSFPAEFELPSPPPLENIWDSICQAFSALILQITNTANTSATWAQEHPEELKTVGLYGAAAIVLALTLCTLCTLVPAISALLGAAGGLVLAVLKLVPQLVMHPVRLLLRGVELILRAITNILHALLPCIGFTFQGVRPGSLAALGQSAFYGPNTGGFFSGLQSAGARRG